MPSKSLKNLENQTWRINDSRGFGLTRRAHLALPDHGGYPFDRARLFNIVLIANDLLSQ
jgi:hypothetical protein